MTATVEALRGEDAVVLWEAGRNRHPIDRAVLMLASTLLDAPNPTGWALGLRDAQLLRLRQATFGDRLDCRATCPTCAAPVELSLSCAVLLEHTEAAPVEGDLSVAVDGQQVTFRLPDSTDLAAIAALETVAEARAVLVDRCVVRCTGSDGVAEVPPSEAAILAIGEHMVSADPCAEILLDLSCPYCSAAWQATLDIASILWSEVSAQARRLLTEVDALARAYGWTEADVLSLTASRRASYLELVLG